MLVHKNFFGSFFCYSTTMHFQKKYFLLAIILAASESIHLVGTGNWYVTKQFKQGTCNSTNTLYEPVCNPNGIYPERIDLFDGHRIIIITALIGLILLCCYLFLRIRSRVR